MLNFCQYFVDFTFTFTFIFGDILCLIKKNLVIALMSTCAITTANAAALDRSGQDVTEFLQDGYYAEAVYTYVDANISGHDNAAGGVAIPRVNLLGT